MSTRTVARSKTAEERIHPAVPAIAVFGLSLGFLLASLSGQFTVRQIHVVGRNLPVAAIDQSARVAGANIFTVRSDAVVANLQSVQEIAVRRVDVSFPDRVIIYARLRHAMAAWRTGAGLFLLDPEGRIIKPVKSTRLPIISSTEKNGSLGPGIVEAVREAVILLPPAPDGAIGAFTYNPHVGLTITGRSGWQAIVGSGSRRAMVNRIATLAGLLAKMHSRGQRFSTVDLRLKTPYAKLAP
jgi:cell division septal protein FtsQ